MAVLVIAHHDDHSIEAATLNAVTAARLFGGDVHVVVAGALCANAAKSASRIAGVATVVRIDGAAFGRGASAEALAAHVAAMARGYSDILVPASPAGNALAARIASRLGVEAIQEVGAVLRRDACDTQVQAGGRWFTLRRAGGAHVMSVRPDRFEAAAREGGMASFRCMEAAVDAGQPQPQAA